MAESATEGCRSGYGSAKLLCIRVHLPTGFSTFASNFDLAHTDATRQDPSSLLVLPSTMLDAVT